MTGPPIACPRCGYDLFGAVAAWEGACPLRGVCSECGLELWWADVLNPSLAVPAWSFEHARGRLLRRLVATSWRAGAPWLLWKRLRMEDPISLRRLLYLALVWLALAHLAIGLEHAMANYQAALSSGSATSGVQAATMAAPSLLWPYTGQVWYGAGWRVWPAQPPVRITSVLLMLALLLLIPLTLLLLPDSLRRAKVRRRHIVRGSAYALAVVPVIAALWAVTSLLGRLDVRIWVWSSWQYVSMFGGLIVLLGFAWQWLHWWMFARRYLRLPHGAAVAAMMIVLPAMFLLTVAAVLDGVATVQWMAGWWSNVVNAVSDVLRRL